MAQVVSVDTVDEEGLVDQIMAEHLTWERARVVAVIQALAQAVTGLVEDGYRVNLAGLVQFFPVMTGKFRSADDEYEKYRHELGVAAVVGARLVEEVRRKLCSRSKNLLNKRRHRRSTKRTVLK